jgi:glucose dehydrogenase
LSFHFRYRPANAYLIVDDAITGERLWSGRHIWGGLLTGFNSAGRRLVHKLRNQIEH